MRSAFPGFGNGAKTTIGFGDTFVGNQTGANNTTGSGNVFVGGSVGSANTTGGANVFVGDFAGSANTTGGSNTAIGYAANVGSGNLTNATALGSGALVSTNNTVVLGRAADAVSVPGALGIGTPTPASALEVRGDVRLGAAGQYLAPGATENLRIVRGVVSGAGGILAGAGTYTVLHPSTGIYTITFVSPFTALPAITATVESGAGAARLATMQNVSSTSATFNIFVPNTSPSPTLAEGAFHFIAIGPR